MRVCGNKNKNALYVKKEMRVLLVLNKKKKTHAAGMAATFRA